ncbi:PREDICTED: uncharacterized protein LOC106302506 [Brassica oleracea var. oleracea]|uniref:uncharacterized protein LOC106302506 n=1 Tax=Brassica oleracea var. oleracea TaxID=109376 RepID=UPI0006A6B352|nr:PREDICTED: uncharacterized protein LOC106302506 [Brassica oleracea var. oleracea]
MEGNNFSKLVTVPVALKGGSNYLVWSRLVKTAIGRLGLWSHITDDGPKPVANETEEGSLDVPLLEAYSYCKTPKHLWETLLKTFGNVSNIIRVFELKRAINSMKQDGGELTKHRKVWIIMDVIKYIMRSHNLPFMEEVCVQLQKEEGSLGLFGGKGELTMAHQAEGIQANKAAYRSSGRKYENLDESYVPRSYEEAMLIQEWRDSVNGEADAMIRNDTWYESELPKGKRAVSCKWIFTIKYLPNGKIDRRKTRLVATDSTILMAAYRSSGRNYEKYEGSCEHCKRTGHKKSECWILHPHLRPRGSNRDREAKAHLSAEANGAGHTFKDHPAQHGILHQTSCPYTPQQNGVAERKNRHLMELARSMMFHKSVPKRFWSDAVMTACYLINRIPTRILEDQSPFEGYKCFDPTARRVLVSRDVKFMEDKWYYEEKNWEELEELSQPSDRAASLRNILDELDIGVSQDQSRREKPTQVAAEEPSHFEHEGGSESEAEGLKDQGSEEAGGLEDQGSDSPEAGEEIQIQEEAVEEQVEVPLRRITQVRRDSYEWANTRNWVNTRVLYNAQAAEHPSQAVCFFAELSEEHYSFMESLDESYVPRSYEEAMLIQEWRDSVNDEADAMIRNDTWYESVMGRLIGVRQVW